VMKWELPQESVRCLSLLIICTELVRAWGPATAMRFAIHEAIFSAILPPRDSILRFGGVDTKQGDVVCEKRRRSFHTALCSELYRRGGEGMLWSPQTDCCLTLSNRQRHGRDDIRRR